MLRTLQTFSSIISVIFEYGFFIGILYLLWFFNKIKKIRMKTAVNNKPLSQYIKFLGFYLFILFLVQNYLEYPEIVMPIVIIIKAIEIDNFNNKSNEFIS